MATANYMLHDEIHCILDILEDDANFEEEVEEITTQVSMFLHAVDMFLHRAVGMFLHAIINNKCNCVVAPIFNLCNK